MANGLAARRRWDESDGAIEEVDYGGDGNKEKPKPDEEIDLN